MHLDLRGYACPPHNPYNSTASAQGDRALLLHPVSKPIGRTGTLPVSCINIRALMVK